MSGGNGTEPVGAQVIYATPGPSAGQVLGNYAPNSCGDPVLKGDQHYVNFDTSGLIGEKIKLKIYDNSTAGCGFVAFDHFYQTDQPRGLVAGVLSKPLLPVNVTLEGPVAIQKLIPGASFENPVDMVTRRGWVATGAFASPTATSWQGTTGTEAAAARVGDRAISTCEMNNAPGVCDAPVGTLTSPPFQVTDTYLNYLMHGGGAGGVGLRVLDTLGNVLHTYVPTTCGPSRISIVISDTNNDCFGGANLHTWSFSTDGGLTKAQFENCSYYHFCATVCLDGNANAEGGLRVSPWWSPDADGKFMINAATGEIACFSGRLPFYTFTGAYGIRYQRGSCVLMDVVYNPHSLSASDPGTITYSITIGPNFYTSGPLPFDMGNPTEDPPHGLFGELVPAYAGGYFQIPGGNGLPLGMVATWSNICYENLGATPTVKSSWGKLKTLYR